MGLRIVRDWQEQHKAALAQFDKEEDQAQNDVYEEFLKTLGLEHTEQLWDAFILAWTAGEGWGLDREYSYPS